MSLLLEYSLFAEEQISTLQKEVRMSKRQAFNSQEELRKSWGGEKSRPWARNYEVCLVILIQLIFNNIKSAFLSFIDYEIMKINNWKNIHMNLKLS